MHPNPVIRGLVKHPKDWPWSSWSFYAKGEPGAPSVLFWVVKGKKFARSIGRSDRENEKSVIRATRPTCGSGYLRAPKIAVGLDVFARGAEAAQARKELVGVGDVQLDLGA